MEVFRAHETGTVGNNKSKQHLHGRVEQFSRVLATVTTWYTSIRVQGAVAPEHPVGLYIEVGIQSKNVH